ncbi:MAG: NAD(P)H-hydrate dehydratase [Nitrospiraceae bacterium]
MKIVTASQMQALDQRAIKEARIPSLTLMEHAGAGVVDAMERTLGSLAEQQIIVLCGKGNNGGDGFVVARLAKQKRASVHVALLSKLSDLSADAKTMYRRFVGRAGSSRVHTLPSRDRLSSLLSRSHVAVDALLGTGLSSAVTGPYQAAIETVNQARDLRIVAVDLPSGIHADTGAVLGTAVRASLTVTFGLPKLGLYTGPGIDHAGKVHIVDIGIPESYVDLVDSQISLLTLAEARRLLPARLPSSHKGSFGHAAIIAGSVGKTGAAALAAKAALRVGAGLATVATPSGVNDILEAKLTEAMTVPMPETTAHTLALAGMDQLLAFSNERTAVAIGPGLTTHPETVDLLHALIPRLERPTVLDADALNALVGRTSLIRECKTPPILTPHPGEMARLEDESTPQSVNADRIGTAGRFARQRRAILVLKGARTVVAHPDGQIVICPTGNPGMATAGTGDALTGMIVGLLAQRLSPWDAACVGPYYHGLAGDLAAEELGGAGMTAGDLVDRIPHALSQTVRY